MTDIYRLKTGVFTTIAKSQNSTFLSTILQRLKNRYPLDKAIRLSNNPPLNCTTYVPLQMWMHLDTHYFASTQNQHIIIMERQEI